MASVIVTMLVALTAQLFASDGAATRRPVGDSISLARQPVIASIAVDKSAGFVPPVDALQTSEEYSLKMASICANIVNNIRDYSCTLRTQERIDGRLSDEQSMFVKIRHEPFSVYMCFLGPEKIRGREVLYVAGKNNEKLLAHCVGIRKLVGTIALTPTGTMAMRDHRHPITETGVLNMARRLLAGADENTHRPRADIKLRRNEMIDHRLVTCIEVRRETDAAGVDFSLTRIYVDQELKIPTRYEAYDRSEIDGQPSLLEKYSYTDIKVNNGFSDADFDDHNPSYQFH
jgi:hypothetical protein